MRGPDRCCVERRAVDFLLKMCVRDSGNCRDAPLHLLGHPEIGRTVIPDGSDVDLRGKPEIENLGHNVGGLEIEYVLRKGRWQHLAQFADILGGGRVAHLERD